MRQTDRCNIENVLNIAKNLNDPSTMLQRVAIVISEQRHLTLNFQPIQCARAPARSRTAFPSGAKAEQLTVCAIVDEGRKLEEERLRKEEGPQKRKHSHPAETSTLPYRLFVRHV